MPTKYCARRARASFGLTLQVPSDAPHPRPNPREGNAYYVLGLRRLSCVDIFCKGSTADGAWRAVVVYSARLHALGSSKHCTVISAASARDTKLTFSGS